MSATEVYPASPIKRRRATESEMEEGPALEESSDRIGRFDDDLELGGAGLTSAGDVEDPETRKG